MWRLYFTMYEILNNCDELIEFISNRLADYPYDSIEFQGDELPIDRNGEPCVIIPDYVEEEFYATLRGKCI